jgi:putative transposase
MVVIPAPRCYRALEKKLRRAQKHLNRCQKGSRKRSVAPLKVAQVHEHIANRRQDFLHQLSHLMVSSCDAICFEDLALKSLAKTKQAKSWPPSENYRDRWHTRHCGTASTSSR